MGNRIPNKQIAIVTSDRCHLAISLKQGFIISWHTQLKLSFIISTWPELFVDWLKLTDACAGVFGNSVVQYAGNRCIIRSPTILCDLRIQLGKAVASLYFHDTEEESAVW